MQDTSDGRTGLAGRVPPRGGGPAATSSRERPATDLRVTGHARRGRRRDAGHRRRGRGRRLRASSTRCTRRARASPRSARSAARSTSAREDLLVVIDPIDGSTNAKRGLPHHSLSIAVADGPTMADVVFGYVYDFGPQEEWTATRGGGAVPRRRAARARPRPSAAARTAGSSCSASSPPTRADPRRRRRARRRRAPPARARARSP